MKKFMYIVLGFILASQINGKKNVNDPYLMATLYQAHSAEYEALCYQAYNSATTYLDEVLKQPHDKPLAIVVDIDETVLNNIAQIEQQFVDNKSYKEEFWNNWVDAAVAPRIAGACEFLTYAQQNGVETFYISNRDACQTEQTIVNLKKEKFPFADSEHLLLKDKEKGKSPRRDKVSQTHDIVILCGDNLSDFSGLFDEPDEAKRKAETVDNSQQFGTKWIVLPNPTYGNWVDALDRQNPKRNPDKKLKYKEKIRFYRSLMKGF